MALVATRPIRESTRGFVALIVILFIVFMGPSPLTVNRDFAAELRNAVSSQVDYLMLCDIQYGNAKDACTIFDGTSKDAAVKYLAEADPRFPPGHSIVEVEKILRIGHGNVSAGKYSQCYRVAKFKGVTEMYVSPIASDAACSRIEKYRAGDAAIPAYAFAGVPSNSRIESDAFRLARCATHSTPHPGR